MKESYNYKTTLLSLFIKSLGDGFYRLICKYYITGEKTKENFKQLLLKMNKGDYRTYRELSYSLKNCVEIFTEASRIVYDGNNKNIIQDSSFIPEYASDKYYFNFRTFFYIFKWGADFDDFFFYESFENVLSYMIAKKFYVEQNCENYLSTKNTEDCENPSKANYNDYPKGYYKNLEEFKKERKISIQKFRPEYQSSIIDVRYNKKENKTFFKWIIDEFYKQINDENKANEIVKYIFGENDGSISTTFEKLKYESGKRQWLTFEKLFKNEHNDEKLMKLLQEDEILAAFQIFQSRMFVAYFLENFCAELPNFVGEKNAKELIKIIVGNDSKKKPSYFLIPNHKEKTEAYKTAIYDILDARNSYQATLQKLEVLDKNCPATETIKAYCTLLNHPLKWTMNETEVQHAFGICKENCHFLFNFGNYVGLDLKGISWGPEAPYLL